MTRDRRLNSEERRLWKRVTDTVRARTTMPPPSADMENLLEEVQARDLDRQGRPHNALHSRPAPATGGARTSRPVTLPHDRSGERRVRRGRVEIDATLDLHGMTSTAAVHQLVDFVTRCVRQHHRRVLVITGKGGYAADGGYAGILHRSLPLWLERPDIAPLLTGYAPAHTRHGGAGAWYLFLRKSPDSPSR